MRIEDFEFETDSLYCSTIEEKICDRCGLKYADSSNSPVYFKVGEYYNIRIYTQTGNISCHISVSEKPKSKNTNYLFHVSCVDIKRKN